MTRTLGLLIVSLSCLSAAIAQDTPAEVVNAPGRITFMQSGANEMIKDLEYVLSLTNTEEQKQWKVIQEYFDEVFLMGIDRTKPIRMDIILSNANFRYRPSFPVIRNLGDFRKNLDGFGIVNRRVKSPKDTYLYRLELKDEFEGYMMADPDTGYASISADVKDIPFNLADPRDDLKLLLERKYDIGLEILNPTEDAAGADQRRAGFKFVREYFTKDLKRLEDESDDDFEIRKLFVKHMLDEGERFCAESEHGIFGWTGRFDAEKKAGRLDIELKALEGTDLDKGIRELGTKPSRFGSVAKSEQPIFSGRILFPLDGLRQTNFLEMSKLIRARMSKHAEVADDRSDAEKTASKKAYDLFFDMVDAGINAGVLDGFAEAHKNASRHNTLVGAVRAADGNAARAILEILPQTKQGRASELDVDSEGDVKIHKATFTAGDLDDFKAFLGDDLTLYVGTSADTLWLAGGENALAELKAAIQAAAQPAEPSADGTFVDVFMQAGPWVDLWSRRRGDQGNAKLRKFANDAFKLGEDTMSVNLKQSEGKVTGEMAINPGILRFAGKVIADFSKENLEE